MEDLVLSVCLSGLFILWLIKVIFSKKIEKYEKYLQYATIKMIERADETFDEMDKSGKHSFVAKKVYKLIPSCAKAFISEVKIDNWIHQYVHQLRQKQKEVAELTTRVIVGSEEMIVTDSYKLKNLINEARKSTKITVEPMIDLEKFKKSKIGIKFEKII